MKVTIFSKSKIKKENKTMNTRFKIYNFQFSINFIYFKFFLLFFVLFFCIGSNKLLAGDFVTVSKLIKVQANPKKGFHWPYYLYIPEDLKKASISSYIFVIPNNSGVADDNFTIQDKSAKNKIEQFISDDLGMVILSPVFPRPKSDWQLYTHALDRDTLLTNKKELVRLDLQLISMINDATKKLKVEKIKVNSKILMMGFSASGMFVNRFTFLHREIVKAAAIGSPGGWPILPVPEWNEKKLRYPIGVVDLKEITKIDFKKENLKQSALYFYLGDQDKNDSVIYEDSYDLEDKELIFSLFGDTPVSRWSIAEKIYKDAGCNCEFKTYKNVGHWTNNNMMKDIKEFFQAHMQ